MVLELKQLLGWEAHFVNQPNSILFRRQEDVSVSDNNVDAIFVVVIVFVAVMIILNVALKVLESFFESGSYILT